MIRVAINGYGRIGRCLVRALYESPLRDQITIVAINDLAEPAALAHLTHYDSIHGRFPIAVTLVGTQLDIQGHRIHLYQEAQACNLPWQELEIDLVFECTGRYTTRTQATAHLSAGAKKVLISAPAQDVDHTIVYGVNHADLLPNHRIVSNASCTTNCLAPLLKVIDAEFTILQGLMTTVHAYTSDQMLVDGYHKDLRRARAAAGSIIPTQTGATRALGLVLPHLEGKLDGLALRVPTNNVSLVDVTLTLAEQVTISEINTAFRSITDKALQHVLSLNEDPLVSIDFNHTSASCIVDLSQTLVCQNTLKVIAWYDNEWGFANRMLDVAVLMYE